MKTAIGISLIACLAAVSGSATETASEPAPKHRLIDHFGDLAAATGNGSSQRVRLLAGPTPAKMLNDGSSGRRWDAVLTDTSFVITIQDATGLEVDQVLARIERMPCAYRPALAIVSEPGKAGVAFYKDLDGAAAHGSQDYLNVVPDVDTDVLLHEAGHVLEQRYRTRHPDVLDAWASLIPQDGISVSEYGDHVAHEDLAEFAMVYAFCLDAGGAKLADLRRLSPRRFELWEKILAEAPTIPAAAAAE